AAGHRAIEVLGQLVSSVGRSSLSWDAQIVREPPCSYNRAPMRLITSTHDLSQFCERLARHQYVTVDTECIREQTFWPKLCLIQLAAPGHEAIVDPLEPGIDLVPFHRLMANEKVVKVFHAARQDLEIVWTQARLVPHPIFDTQVAAMVCGFGESVSYVN